jgi:hypothetical protein
MMRSFQLLWAHRQCIKLLSTTLNTKCPGPMPTIFAHNSTSYRTSHLPKGLRRYEVIRSSASPCTTPPLTDTEVCHRPDPVKSLAAPPALHPEKSPLKSPSSLIQGEVQRDERVRPVGAKPLQNHLINPEILTKGTSNQQYSFSLVFISLKAAEESWSTWPNPLHTRATW